MVLRLYNTMIRQKQDFAPSKSKIGLYACGPTVYLFAHIGNLRPYVMWDVLHKVLVRRKYAVLHVMNITDVGHLVGDDDSGEDKIEKTAREEKKTPGEIADFFTHAFLKDLDAMHVERPGIICKAREHVPEMIKLIQKLEKKGYTYLTPSGVYFDTQKFKGYGKLARLNVDELKAVRKNVERDDSKKHPADFRLWQINQPGHIQQWDSPWGRGYPGWHIECSAMSMKYLGEHFDIHAGGNDHISIHHPNEIAQSEAATGKPFVDVWMHNAFMRVDGQKMSKSLKNTYLLSDLSKKGFDALDYRYLLLTAHYRSEINFTWTSLEAAQKTRRGWNELIKRLQKYAGKESSPEMKEWLAETNEKVEASLDDDLNTPLVLAQLSDFSRKINEAMSKETMSKSDARKVLDFLKDVDEVLGVFDFEQKTVSIPAHVVKLAQEREAARKAKDWKKADSLRSEITKEGYVVVDTSDGFEINPLG
jgi:cysteinyl-tRNA synthetase